MFPFSQGAPPADKLRARQSLAWTRGRGSPFKPPGRQRAPRVSRGQLRANRTSLTAAISASRGGLAGAAPTTPGPSGRWEGHSGPGFLLGTWAETRGPSAPMLKETVLFHSCFFGRLEAEVRLEKANVLLRLAQPVPFTTSQFCSSLDKHPRALPASQARLARGCTSVRGKEMPRSFQEPQGRAWP